MTGFKSKKAAALDEEGMYLVHQTDHSEVVLNMVAQPAQEPVAWGVDWGKAGDIHCVSIIKRLPNGGIKVMAVEYAPYSYTTPPQPEPVAYCYVQKGSSVDILTFDDEPSDSISGTLFPLYAHPQRPWVDLTPQDLNEIFAVERTGEDAVHLASDKLKEKNNAA